MHIAIDAVGIKHSGGARVVLDLLEVALEHERISRVTLFASPRPAREFELPKHPRLVVQCHRLMDRSYPFRVFWAVRGVSAAARSVGADGLLGLTGLAVGGETMPTVTFIQQSLPFCREALSVMELRWKIGMRVIQELMRISARRAKAVLVQTPTMEKWVAREFDLAESGVFSFLPAPNPLDTSQDPMPATAPIHSVKPNRRLLYVGNTAKYKNLNVLKKGMRHLRRRVPEATLFGTWASNDPFLRQDGLVGFGLLDEPSLAQTYQLSTILVQPSLVETVSLPIGEAMSLGTPVLAADRPYAHDVTEEVALFFDPARAEDFADRAAQLLTDEGLRERLSVQGKELIEKRRQTRPYARMVERVYQSLM